VNNFILQSDLYLASGLFESLRQINDDDSMIYIENVMLWKADSVICAENDGSMLTGHGENVMFDEDGIPIMLEGNLYHFNWKRQPMC